jgi:hypothetical protein
LEGAVQGLGRSSTSVEVVQVLDGSPAEADLEEIVAQIRALKRDATFLFVSALGRLIIDRFYGGDLNIWRREGAKNLGLRRLAQRLSTEAGLGLDASALSRAVGIYGLVSGIAGVATSQHLKVGHFVAVLALEPADAERLLLTAEAERWPVRTLREEAAKRVATHTDPIRKRPGRKPTPAFARGIRQFRTLLDRRDELLDSVARIDEVAPAEAAEMLDTLTELSGVVQRLQRALQARTASLAVGSIGAPSE